MLLRIDCCANERVDDEKNTVLAVNHSQKWSLAVTGWLPLASSTGAIAKYYLSKQERHWGCQSLCQEECSENWMGCYRMERLQWPLTSHRRAGEEGPKKMRRQKMSIFPTDMGTGALPLVFVTVLFEPQIAELSPEWGRLCLDTSRV